MCDIHIDEIIARVDALELGNQYDAEQKVVWLSELDGQIYDEVIATHEGGFPRFAPGHVWPGDPLDQGVNGSQYEREPPEPPDPEEDGQRRPRRPHWTWPYTCTSDLLLVGPPYGKELYEHYLRMKIADGNMETAKRNEHTVMFNAAYQNYCNWYNRTHMPKRPRGGNRYRY